MNKAGPIIFIEDDIDDQEVFSEIINALGYKNECLFFSDGEKALLYLADTNVKPFIIFSDINMPKLTGMELREKIHENEDLRLKSIPFLFFTTSAEQDHVVHAYSKSVQGFFIKPHNYSEIKETIRSIVEYWNRCVSPNYTK